MTYTLLEVGAIVKSAQDVWAGPGYILMSPSRIEEVGQGDYPGNRAGITVVKRPHTVAIPGLVNAHGHAAMTLLRGIGDDLPLMTWLTERVFPFEAKLTEDAIYWGTMLACWEMIRSGTTCFTDMYMSMHRAAGAVEDSGMRAVLSWGMVGLDEQSARNGIANSQSFVKTWNGQADGRVTTTLGPHAPYTCPPEYLQRVADLSAKLDVPVQIHLCETRGEVEDSQTLYGKSPIAHVQSCGLLDRPVLAAHCVHVSDEDIAMMREYDVRVAHNPQSNLKLASGIAPIPRMKRAGLTVGVGTDGAASNNNLDMFEEMRLTATLHKAVAFDASVVPAAEAFQMATEDSARAIFLPSGSGTLEQGMAADITLLDLRSPHFIPSHNLLSNVVYAAGADDVTDVFVAGRALLSNREPQTLDTERIQYETTRIAEALSS